MPDYSKITLDTIRTSAMPAAISAAMLRLDQLHPEISGNKWFKLKYNLEDASAAGKSAIVTFGGAYSNHIAATAAACRDAGLRAIGIIRGEEMRPDSNATLRLATANGMELRFVSRETYKVIQQPANPLYQALAQEGFVIPEGGHNAAGAKGCEDILRLHPTSPYTHILCAVGTGTTLAGIINSAARHQQVLGISVLKGAAYLQQEITTLLLPGHTASWQLLTEHHGGGYGKFTSEQLTTMNEFYQETRIPTDIIYTGKLIQAFNTLLKTNYFPDGSNVLLIHTGGLQGNSSVVPGTLAF
ncbi:1-aminocyclopropane-1-carboxylate deaminase/D-cysteine desulfhydrase [Chitinophaga sp. sic0106]|uniref:1-aminocyclopropane-1-carboxylate deaminase/D-cysteine desulfhydrase n=1 Tax=Chitinophaga sp. sic0106 TaxID=2854785 RepID=UPI001C478A66|nr:pyridoxal-phosphate dependent enzyme [Chitinophaga sp. sic0106]MBV7531932.1 pyridoxal-phosphate dependent enzyme [Chitinophaga sp. sic0106]